MIKFIPFLLISIFAYSNEIGGGGDIGGPGGAGGDLTAAEEDVSGPEISEQTATIPDSGVYGYIHAYNYDYLGNSNHVTNGNFFSVFLPFSDSISKQDKLELFHQEIYPLITFHGLKAIIKSNNPKSVSKSGNTLNFK